MLGLSLACKPGAKPTSPPISPTAALSFPPELRAKDETVNQFIEEAMVACAAGDYAKFAACWGPSEKPLTLREFDRGWRAIRELRVEALNPFRNEPAGPIRYYLRANAQFDRSVPEKDRAVELVLVQDEGAWRLTRAPGELRARLEQAERLAGNASP